MCLCVSVIFCMCWGPILELYTQTAMGRVCVCVCVRACVSVYVYACIFNFCIFRVCVPVYVSNV